MKKEIEVSKALSNVCKSICNHTYVEKYKKYIIDLFLSSSSISYNKSRKKF